MHYATGSSIFHPHTFMPRARNAGAAISPFDVKCCGIQKLAGAALKPAPTVVYDFYWIYFFA
jgi:hypothetical protein